MRRWSVLSFGAVSALAVLSLLAGPALAQERWEWGGRMHPMWGMWGIWGLGMVFMMLAFWALVIAGMVLGIRWLVRQGRPPERDRALEILRERYARGEIGKEEFESKKRDLF